MKMLNLAGSEGAGLFVSNQSQRNGERDHKAPNFRKASRARTHPPTHELGQNSCLGRPRKREGMKRRLIFFGRSSHHPKPNRPFVLEWQLATGRRYKGLF
ncbi:hypothetical protein M378DRAFT_159544 [Amanita muscaria Koide BX008]|uniref:Uncharacterized protein n=1 Tax=Amanita muscaria (strain Koide BX008) TaxID=946122 RepID=A0A0C2XFP7_AMAMK|nr:hypothetical protein M378DRAFT_159544 [Amanita muscaria Koide BX008]